MFAWYQICFYFRSFFSHLQLPKIKSFRALLGKTAPRGEVKRKTFPAEVADKWAHWVKCDLLIPKVTASRIIVRFYFWVRRDVLQLWLLGLTSTHMWQLRPIRGLQTILQYIWDEHHIAVWRLVYKKLKAYWKSTIFKINRHFVGLPYYLCQWQHLRENMLVQKKS